MRVASSGCHRTPRSRHVGNKLRGALHEVQVSRMKSAGGSGTTVLVVSLNLLIGMQACKCISLCVKRRCLLDAYLVQREKEG